jgi:hypothetical protein
VKRFNGLLNRLRLLSEMYLPFEAYFRRKPLRSVNNFVTVHRPSGIELVAMKPRAVNGHHWAEFCLHQMRDTTGVMETWLMAGLFTQGVKTFCPTLREYQALSKVDLNIRWADYRQPFETFCVALPDGFSHPSPGAFGNPVVGIARHCPEDKVTVVTAITEGGLGLSSLFAWGDGEEQTIEQHIRAADGRPGVDSDNLRGELEESVAQEVKRVVMNACLLLTQYGAKRVGYANPEFAAKLEAKAKKRSIPEHIRESNRITLKLMPDVYAFDQSVRLYDREDSPHAGGGEGHECKPHWRRGHWAMQAHGVNSSLRKRIFRRPVLVNAHRFQGEMADTKVTYSA